MGVHAYHLILQRLSWHRRVASEPVQGDLLRNACSLLCWQVLFLHLQRMHAVNALLTNVGLPQHLQAVADCYIPAAVQSIAAASAVAVAAFVAVDRAMAWLSEPAEETDACRHVSKWIIRPRHK